MTQLQIENEKEKKLAELKESLDEQKISFLSKKIEKLLWIKEMEEKYKFPETVTNSDIKECKEKLEDVKVENGIKKKIGYRRKIHPYTLEPYNEKLLIELEDKNKS